MRGATFASRVSLGVLAQPTREALRMLPPLDSALPDGGFPRGAVVELTSPANVGQGLSVALAACAASQRESVQRGGAMSWCAILDPDATLFAPAVRASGVCLERLLVIRPPRSLLARVAVRVALSRIFSVIVVDVGGVPGAWRAAGERPSAQPLDIWPKATRRLALAVEQSPTTLFLLTEALLRAQTALPVAMRVELEREQADALLVRVTKDRFGRVPPPRHIAWPCPSSDVLRAAARGESCTPQGMTGGESFSQKAVG
jgi:hypothetical protein